MRRVYDWIRYDTLIRLEVHDWKRDFCRESKTGVESVLLGEASKEEEQNEAHNFQDGLRATSL